MTTSLMPEGRQRYFNNDGTPCAGGKLWTYAAGTTALKTTYADEAGTVPNTNPITLDAKGEAVIYWSGAYKVDLKQADGTQVTGYPVDHFNTDPAGLWGLVATLATALGATMLGWLQAGAGAVLRTIADKFKETISVKDFGAKGDGATNDTAAIAKADAYAASIGANLFFPAGTYMADALTATTSWRGERKSTIKYRGTSNVDLVTADGVDNIEFQCLELDGAVSADPGAWSAANYDAFTGATGLTIANCEGASVVRCRAKNTRQHGFRLLSTTNALLDRCTTNRSRGNFGDGFYMNSTIGTMVRNCRAYDFTRIGFVFDTFGTDPKTGYHNNITACSAEYGHDCSLLYGGAEYNAGLWAENSAHFNIDGFTAKRMDRAFARGVVLTTGIQNNGVVGAAATYNACNITCEDTAIGLIAYSLGTFPVAVNVTNLKAYKVYQGVAFTANNPTDSFECTSAYVDIDFTVNPNVTTAYGYGVKPGLSGKPSISFVDCTVAHTNEDLSKLTSYGTSSAVTDVGQWTGDPLHNGAHITVRNLKNAAGGPVWINNAYRQPNDTEISNTYVRMPYAGELWTGSMRLDNCRVHSAMLGEGTSSKTELIDCTIEGLTHVGGDSVAVKGGSASFATADDFLWLFATPTDKRPAIIVSDFLFKKDIAANGKCMRIGFAGTFKCTALLNDVQFYNTSGTATAGPCLAYSPGTGQIIFNNVLKDATVTNIYDYDSGGNPGATYAGVADATFH
jgi:hypothetical protein